MRIYSSATKKNSHRDSNNRLVFGGLLGIALIGFGLLVFARGSTGTAASHILQPFVIAKSWYLNSTASLPQYLRTQSALISEIQSLKDAALATQGDKLLIQQLREENNALAETLGLASEETITARVLVRPPQTPYDTLIIDVGSASGVARGAAVYIDGTIAIGVLAEVYERSALVHLVSTPGTHASAYVYGPDVFTEAEGMGDGVLRITVPQGVPLAVGDIVALPGTRARAYGSITDVVTLPSSPYQYGSVTSPIPLRSMRFVQVAKKVLPNITYEEAATALASSSSTPFLIEIPESVLIGTTTPAETVSSP